MSVLVVGDANPDLVLQGDVVPRFGQAEQLVQFRISKSFHRGGVYLLESRGGNGHAERDVGLTGRPLGAVFWREGYEPLLEPVDIVFLGAGYEIP